MKSLLSLMIIGFAITSTAKASITEIYCLDDYNVVISLSDEVTQDSNNTLLMMVNPNDPMAAGRIKGKNTKGKNIPELQALDYEYSSSFQVKSVTKKKYKIDIFINSEDDALAAIQIKTKGFERVLTECEVKVFN